MLIKEVQELLSMSSHTLRYYEKMGLIKPTRDSNGYRNYSEEDVIKLKKIRYLRELEIPIEDIVQIMNNSIDFQNVLENHIKILETQIKSLQYVNEICNDLKEKEIPILTALTNDKIVQDAKIDESKVKKGLKKVVEYFKPLRTVVIGTRLDAGTFWSGQPAIIIGAIFMGTGLGVGLPNMFDYINGLNVIEPIKWFSATPMNVLIIIILSYFFVLCLFTMINSNQKYIELTDNRIYICSHEKQSKISIILGTILKQSRERNLKYEWEELLKVEIRIIFSTVPIYHAGTRTIYLPTFKFYFLDGNIFEIESGKAIEEDPKTAYKILKDKKIEIIAEDFIIEYFEQDKTKGYDFFEEIYHMNSKRTI